MTTPRENLLERANILRAKAAKVRSACAAAAMRASANALVKQAAALPPVVLHDELPLPPHIVVLVEALQRPKA